MQGGHAHIVTFLLEQRKCRDVLDAFDLDGRTAFWHACRHGQATVAALLLDLGANVLVRREFEWIRPTAS